MGLLGLLLSPYSEAPSDRSGYQPEFSETTYQPIDSTHSHGAKLDECRSDMERHRYRVQRRRMRHDQQRRPLYGPWERAQPR